MLKIINKLNINPQEEFQIHHNEKKNFQSQLQRQLINTLESYLNVLNAAYEQSPS